MTSGSPYRLPRTVTPSHYAIELRLDPNAPTFDGTQDVAITVHEPVTEIALNGKELTVHAGTVIADGGSKVGIAKAVPDPSAGRITLELPDELAAGSYTLRLSFTGRLSDLMEGMYRSRFTDDAGRDHVLITTHFEATDARRNFPCWDEPDLKASFQMTLVVPEGMTALTNTPELGREAADRGLTRITFDRSMVMSTYLVCVVVGDLGLTAPSFAGPTPIRVACRPDRLHLAAYANEVAAFALDWFGAYYAIPYPERKLDQAAIPDFAQGAMENTGLVTYRETLLLLDPALASYFEQLDVAETIAHELAHMWFGDLVTMRWWNGIWLNEAFATFMEIAACDAYRPDWDRWTSFGLERTIAFETDSLASTRSVEYEVRSPADCEGMFDVLTYQKGGALLRMLEQYLGAERFRQGVSHYLRAHSYGNTDTGDLWDAIEHTSGEPVRRIMDSWIWQPGYPLVSARSDGAGLGLDPRRFTFDPEAAASSLWAIPISVRQGDRDDRVLLDGDETRLPLGEGAVLVNAGGHGFYRVAYSDELRERITDTRFAGMSTLERYNLVDDAWNAVTTGAMDAMDWVALAERFVDEREYGVWQSIAIGLRAVRRLIGADDVALPGYQARVRALVGPALAELGEPVAGETDLTAKVRGLLLGL